MSCPNLTSPDLPFRYILHIVTPHTFGSPIDTLQTPSRHLPGTLQTFKTHFRQLLDTLQTPTPDFKHVGVFPLIETRCGFLFCKNKVNSYSDQLKFTWGCKFEVEFYNKLELLYIFPPLFVSIEIALKIRITALIAKSPFKSMSPNIASFQPKIWVIRRLKIPTILHNKSESQDSSISKVVNVQNVFSRRSTWGLVKVYIY